MYTNKAAGRIVQGCNADLIKLSLVEVDDYLKSLGLPPPICTIHDSVELQVPIGRQDIIDEIARIMNNAAQGDLICFSVPQKVDTGVGPNWSIATYGEEA
jgi:DNA polymerase I-like protein with 3'-5' exonuclease and polymerase domains